MKKKIIFGITVCLFAMVTMFNINMSQKNKISDMALKNIAIMTQANAEIDPFQACVQYCWSANNYYCTLWVVGTGIYIDCYDRYPWS